MREIRLDPLRKEWILISSDRGSRPMTVAEKKACPFCRGAPETTGKSAPYWLPNAFPMLSPYEKKIHDKNTYFKKIPAKGYSEVIVESFDHQADLCDLTAQQLKEAMLLYKDRYVELSKQSFVKAVLIFRNLGKLIGVSIEHPHSQIYAVPYIPTVIREEINSSKKACQICATLSKNDDRTLFEDDLIRAILPFSPRWPYEGHIIPKRHLTSLADASDDELAHLGKAIGRLIGCYNHIFEEKMPYILAFHQTPTANYKEKIHLHVEIYPALRAADKMKHWSGAEVGFGVYTYDFLPEDKAEQLADICKKYKDVPIPSKGIPEPVALRCALRGIIFS